MRTTIDLPDAMLARVRTVLAQRRMTLRALVIDCLERELAGAKKPATFRLREASAGYTADADQAVTAEVIDQALREQREPTWRS